MWVFVKNGEVVAESDRKSKAMFGIRCENMTDDEMLQVGIFPCSSIFPSPNEFEDIEFDDYDIQASEVIKKFRIKKKSAQEIRKILESSSFVEFEGKKFKIKDETILNLQSYILAKTESVPWKCDDGSFISLNLTDMFELLSVIMAKKKEVFCHEKSILDEQEE